MKTKWLILSYHANMDGIAASLHIDNRLPYFAQKNIETILLSSTEGKQHESLLHVRVPNVSPSRAKLAIRQFVKAKIKNKFFFEITGAILSIPILPFYLLEKFLIRIPLSLESTWAWCISGGLTGLFLLRKKKPAVVYTTGWSINVHLAGLIMSYFCRTPWIIEFQDPLIHQYPPKTKLRKSFISWIEKKIYKRADRIIFLTEQARLSAASRTGYGHKFVTIYPGAVDDSIAETKGRIPGSKTCAITHAGAFYGTRDLSFFLKGLELLLEKLTWAALDVRIHLYGDLYKREVNQISSFRYHNIIEMHGRVSHKEILDTMSCCDILLLIQHRDPISSETIPSKVYEYLHTGRPILALVYRNPELREMLELMGHIAVEADDEIEIQQGLRTYLERWRLNQLHTRPQQSPFTVERAVGELIALSEDI